MKSSRLQQYRQQQAITRRRQRMLQQQQQQRSRPPMPATMPRVQQLRGQNRGHMIQQQRFNQNRGEPPQPRRNVLFYSEHCPHSQKFIKALEKIPAVSNMFTHVCVDKRGMRLPRRIKVVPTIVVYDSNDRMQTLEDYRAFEWLNHVIDVPIDISDCKPGHMGTKLSDNYSWIDDTEENDYAFAFLEELNKQYIYTPIEDEVGVQDSKLETNYNRLEQARHNDPYINRLKPPSQVPNFTVDAIKESNKVNQTDFDRILQERNRSNRQLRVPVPKHAPNFNSGNFRSTGFQSRRGPGYVAAGENVLDNRMGKISMSDYKRLMSQRRQQQVQRQTAPPRKIDWRTNLKPMRVI